MTTDIDKAADLVRQVAEKLNSEPMKVWVLHAQDINGSVIEVYDSLERARAHLESHVIDAIGYQYQDDAEFDKYGAIAINRLKQDPNTFAIDLGGPCTWVIHPLEVIT